MIGRTKPKLEIPNLSLDTGIFWNKASSNPTPDDIPAELHSLWLNTETGEIFVYLGLMNGKAVWKGQLGTIITPSTVSKFDFFDDGSAVALYQFEGNAIDTGGNYNGTWQGTEQYDTGKFGLGAKGSSGSVIVVGDILEPFDYITFSLWFWGPPKTQVWKQAAFIGFSLYFYGNSISNGGGGSHYYEFFSDYIDDDWNFVAISYDRTNNKIIGKFINGTYTEVNEPFPNTFPTYVSFLNYIDPSAYNYYFPGVIDQVRIFKRILTEEEIQALYNEA